jgi:hypothetical protein
VVACSSLHSEGLSGSQEIKQQFSFTIRYYDEDITIKEMDIVGARSIKSPAHHSDLPDTVGVVRQKVS